MTIAQMHPIIPPKLVGNKQVHLIMPQSLGRWWFGRNHAGLLPLCGQKYFIHAPQSLGFAEWLSTTNISNSTVYKWVRMFRCSKTLFNLGSLVNAHRVVWADQDMRGTLHGFGKRALEWVAVQHGLDVQVLWIRQQAAVDVPQAKSSRPGASYMAAQFEDSFRPRV